MHDLKVRRGRDNFLFLSGFASRSWLVSRTSICFHRARLFRQQYPAWAKDPAIGQKMINARAETIAEKPAFRSAFRARRCIVPASGFYEWHRRGGGPKQPYLIRRRDGEPLVVRCRQKLPSGWVA
jgi:hypothetical protein